MKKLLTILFSLVAATSYSQFTLPSSIGFNYVPAASAPSFDWTFDYTTGSIAEVSGRVTTVFNNNSGSPTTPTFDGANGIDLHTTRGYVNVGTLWTNFTDLTIEWGIYFSPLTTGTYSLTGPTTAQNVGGFGQKITFDYYVGGCEVYFESSTNELRYWSLGGAFSPHTYHTYKIVQDLTGNTMKLYIDGGAGVAASNGTVFTSAFEVNSIFASNSSISSATNCDGECTYFKIKPTL